jgi:hypothetical protein
MRCIIDWFLVCWLRRGRYGWSKFRRWLLERKYLSIILPEVESPEDIETSLHLITWTMDGPLHLFDCISYPQTTWAKKKDDCDGFAMVAAELLNRLNPDYHPVLVTALVHPIRYSHTVCALTSQEGTLWYFDNYSLKSENLEKFEDIVKSITKEHQLVCWDVRNPFNFDMIEFHKHDE